MMLAVTGASGFFGRHFVAAARSRGLGVRALVGAGDSTGDQFDRLGVAVVRGRLGDSACASRLLEGADVLVHLAALGVHSRDRHWLRTAQVNAVEPLEWIEVAARMKLRRVVVAGTCLEYQGRGILPSMPCLEPTPIPLEEGAPLEPSDAYGATKAAGGILMRALARSLGLPMWYLRFASLYGRGDDSAKLIPAAIMAAKRAEPFDMTGGAQIREWLHVEDGVEALCSAVTREPPNDAQILNVGTGKGIPLGELIGRVFESCGTPRDQIRMGTRPYRLGEPHYLVMSCGRASRLLGFAPRVDLEAGLRAMAERLEG
jgi:nucleoside-diphosphate-sugar epimerase